MMIQTLGKKYNVIKYSYSDSNMERFICQEEADCTKYTVVRIKNRMWIIQTMEFLMRQMKDTHFTDFVSCFASEEYFHVVMKYAEGVSLREKLQREHCSLEERMAIGKGILDKIMLLKIPDYFLQDCLKQENIILSSASEVSFQYYLFNITQYGRVSFSQVQACLWILFEALLEQEMKKRVLPSASRFCNSLKKGEYQEILQIYTDFNEVCKEIRHIPPVELATPRTWGFRTWDKVKKYMVPFKKICAFLLMFLAVLFFIYSAYESTQDGGEKKLFEYIGTLDIKERG